MRQKGVLQISNPTANVTFSISGLAVYTITPTLTNCTAQAGNPTTIEQGGTAQLTFLFDGTNYKCPTTAPTVTNATGTWVKVSDTKGNLTLSNPSGAVSFSVVGEMISTGHTVEVAVDRHIEGTVYAFTNEDEQEHVIQHGQTLTFNNVSKIKFDSNTHVVFVAYITGTFDPAVNGGDDIGGGATWYIPLSDIYLDLSVE